MTDDKTPLPETVDLPLVAPKPTIDALDLTRPFSEVIKSPAYQDHLKMIKAASEVARLYGDGVESEVHAIQDHILLAILDAPAWSKDYKLVIQGRDFLFRRLHLLREVIRRAPERFRRLLDPQNLVASIDPDDSPPPNPP